MSNKDKREKHITIKSYCLAGKPALETYRMLKYIFWMDTLYLKDRVCGVNFKNHMELKNAVLSSLQEMAQNASSDVFLQWFECHKNVSKPVEYILRNS